MRTPASVTDGLAWAGLAGHARRVVRILVSLFAEAALGLAGWWLVGLPRPAPPDARPVAVSADRAPRPSTFAAPGGTGLQTPFGDALFRWRCTTGLRDALGERPDWPLRRVAGFCLCVAERMREQALREVPQFRGDGLAAALEAAEASLCHRP
jgi:hypothetical protein